MRIFVVVVVFCLLKKVCFEKARFVKGRAMPQFFMLDCDVFRGCT